MTAPGYVPPPAPGWFVKRDIYLLPTSAMLTLAGGVPGLTPGVQVTPTASSLTLTGSMPTISVVGVSSHYTDDFNRADNASLGANWTDRTPTLGVLKITSNAARLTAATSTAISSYNNALGTDDHKTQVTVGSTVPADIYLVIRASSVGQHVYANCQNGTYWSIQTEGTDWTYSNDINRANSVSTASYIAGDVLSFGAVSNVYSIKKNGVTILSWTDTAFIHPIDSIHRLVGIGMFDTTTTAGVDNFDAIDI